MRVLLLLTLALGACATARPDTCAQARRRELVHWAHGSPPLARQTLATSRAQACGTWESWRP